MIRTNIQRLGKPVWIKHQYLKQYIDPASTYKNYLIPEKIVTPTMTIEDYNAALVDFKKPPLDTSQAIRHLVWIDRYLNEHSSDPNRLTNEIEKYTFYLDGFEKWNITNLCRKYNIEGKDLFLVLTRNQIPYGAGVLNYDKNRQKDENLIKEYERRKKESNKYVYFDWYNGVGIKNGFPIDIHDNQTPVELNMRRYNDRNGGEGYQRILSLVEQKIKAKKEYPFQSYLKTENVEKTIHVIDISPEVEAANEKITDESQKYKQSLYNHRNDYLFTTGEKKVWDYQMLPYYEKIKAEPHLLELAHDFKLDIKYDYWNNNMSRIEDKKDIGKLDISYMFWEPTFRDFDVISVVNKIIFGKSRINKDSLPYLLSLIRFQEHPDYNIQLDNYLVKERMFHTSGKPKYEIEIITDNEVLRKMDLVSDPYEMMIACKYLIKLMNETPPELLNHHNYKVIGDYYMKHDIISQSYNSARKYNR